MTDAIRTFILQLPRDGWDWLSNGWIRECTQLDCPLTYGTGIRNVEYGKAAAQHGLTPTEANLIAVAADYDQPKDDCDAVIEIRALMVAHFRLQPPTYC